MLHNKRLGLYLALFTVLALVLVACQPQTQVVEVTRVVTETIVEEGQEVVVTSIVTETEEVVVTATPEPVEEVSLTAPDPTTYTELLFGDINTLDPALAYDTASSRALDQILEPLIWYNYTDATTYVPMLATEVPSLENGGISEDGMTYTFNIREGVTFHDGGTLEPHDVAYTFQRGLLQSDPNGPQWLFIEPLMGYFDTHDITEEIGGGEYGGDPEALVANASAEELLATCEKVKAAVVADDDAGTVTFNLVQPWGPFLATMAGTWGRIIDMEWAVEQGSWDGDCATWQNHYAPGAANSELTSVVNGTGPYALEYWTPGEEYVLTANQNYWRTEPMWEGGPSGVPTIETVIIRQVDEWGTRFASLQAGDAEWVSVNLENYSQVDALVGESCNWETFECTPTETPDGPLRRWDDLPSTSRTDVFLTWNVAEGSPYIGSAQLDGNGIPNDFFSDINVRKAMATCFDYETYIAEALSGRGVRNNGPIILDMLGYNLDGPMYEYNPEECAAYLEEAHGGQLPETGFRFQIAFNTGNTTRQTVGAIYQSEMAAINPLYQIELVGLPWPTFLRSFAASQLPVSVSGWLEDIHDPHNWVHPYTVGTFAGRSGLPAEVTAQFQEMVTAGVSASDPAEREAVYFDLQQAYYDQAVGVILAQATSNRYEQRWVEGWYQNTAAFAPYYYAMSLRGE